MKNYEWKAKWYNFNIENKSLNSFLSFTHQTNYLTFPGFQGKVFASDNFEQQSLVPDREKWEKKYFLVFKAFLEMDDDKIMSEVMFLMKVKKFFFFLKTEIKNQKLHFTPKQTTERKSHKKLWKGE